ncbi:lysophospholipase [Rhodobacterales bacterium]|nr:lysophospholipase [Rhodobacterales bacterium]
MVLTRLVKRVVIVAVAIYLAATAFMYVNQRGFVFVPTGSLAMPQDKGLQGVTVSKVAMSDGTNVTVWSAPPRDPGLPTVLYLQGNSGNLSSRASRFAQILESGFGLYAPSYRGYAGSEGSPSETMLISDALEQLDRLSATGTQVILHGESLGTGIATAVAAQRDGVELVVLEAPYTALVDMARESYPWLPVGLLMKDQMPTRERIQAVSAPILIVHGVEDRLIDAEHARRLFRLAPEPKDLLLIDGAGHANLWSNGLWQAVLDYRDRLR